MQAEQWNQLRTDRAAKLALLAQKHAEQEKKILLQIEAEEQAMMARFAAEKEQEQRLGCFFFTLPIDWWNSRQVIAARY